LLRWIRRQDACNDEDGGQGQRYPDQDA